MTSDFKQFKYQIMKTDTKNFIKFDAELWN